MAIHSLIFCPGDVPPVLSKVRPQAIALGVSGGPGPGNPGGSPGGPKGEGLVLMNLRVVGCEKFIDVSFIDVIYLSRTEENNSHLRDTHV